MAWRQIIPFNRRAFSIPSNLVPGFANFSSKSTPYLVKVGIPEFLKGVGKGVEAHVEKLESEIGDLPKLLVTRTLKLKKLGIPCKHEELGDELKRRGLHYRHRRKRPWIEQR
ncbi:uncharacterized protein LOC114303937 isoform X1 [Camellia sinensis]|uniref:uncharacterized protein LOC114303937 isoform X1 n=1 Tax=Camellia sinensis TaxID=4442 RepID=UPI001035F88D|nr:uncharacterized protein LOC114303937 isoform X1 [Camellia sinensis]